MTEPVLPAGRGAARGGPSRAGRAGPGEAGEYRIRRAHWASFFPRRTIVAETGSTVRLRVHNRLAQPARARDPGRAGPGTDAEHGRDPAGRDGRADVHPHGGRDLRLQRPQPTPRSSGSSACTARWSWSPRTTGGATCPEARSSSASGCGCARTWTRSGARRARAGEAIDPVATPALPRYFMLNDRSGFHSLAVSQGRARQRAAHEETLAVRLPAPESTSATSASRTGRAPSSTGQLIRMVNLGVAIHQMHFHGNHVWTVRRNLSRLPEGRPPRAGSTAGHVVLQQWEDVVELDPLERKEIVLPDQAAARRDRRGVERPDGGLDLPDALPRGALADRRRAASTPVVWWPTGCSPGQTSPRHPTFVSQAEFASNQPHEGEPRHGVPQDARPGVPARLLQPAACGSPTAPSSRCGASRTRRPGAASRPR